VKTLPIILEGNRAYGEEFLVWLWKRGIADGGMSGLEGDLSCCFVDDSVQLASERGDVKEVSLRKGNPAESQEAFEALARGMRPVRAKLRVLSGDLEWSFTLVASTLDLQALKLPTTASKDPTARLADRLFLMEEGVAHLERRYAAFLRAKAKDPGGVEASLKSWLRDSLTPFLDPESTTTPPWSKP
jgi:hypothetical protein